MMRHLLHRIQLRSTIAFAALVLASVSMMAQETPTLSGTEYYVTFPMNDDGTGGAHPRFMGLMITSQVATVGVVEIPGNPSISFSVKPGEIAKVEIPREIELDLTREEELSTASVHVTSRAPVSVFVVNARFQSTGVYAAVPVNMWGTEYTALSLPNQGGGRASEMVIVAAHDSTLLRVRPSTRTYRANAGQEVTVKLSKGQTYFVQALAGNAGVADLSASDITASRPVGVVAGHVRTSIAPDGAISPSDYATQQMAMLLPDALYGTEYFSVPMRSTGDRFRLMPVSATTTIDVTHARPGGGIETMQLTLRVGEYFDLGSINGKGFTGPVHWKANAPIAIMQLRISGPYGDPAASPAMIPLAPLDRLSTHSAFVAPNEIAFGYFQSHSLTLVARGPAVTSATDPANPLRELKVDGTPVHTLNPAILTQRIGNEAVYYVTLPISSGGHVVTSHPDYPFTGMISGSNGSLARDAYAWPIPYWLQSVQADVTAPYLAATNPGTPKGIVSIVVSDKSDSYFSGVDDVALTASSSGWRRETFQRPAPENDASATFMATADPTGPLVVDLRDRDGNTQTLKLSDPVCFKTAVTTTNSLAMRVENGDATPDRYRIVFDGNICGDKATIHGFDFGSGEAWDKLEGGFEGFTTFPIVLDPHGSVTLVVNGKPGLNVATRSYTTIMRVRVDDSTISIPISLEVQPLSSVTDPVVATGVHVYPNPFTMGTTIELDRPLGPTARLDISDGRGDIVYSLDAEHLAGRTSLLWKGTSVDGLPLPSGQYIIRITDRQRTITREVTLVR